MTLRHRNSWDDLTQYPTELDHWLEHWPSTAGARASGVHCPPMNLEVKPEHYHYYLFIAGVDKDKIELTVDRQMLMLSGEKPVLIPSGKDVSTYRAERKTGKFSRNIKLANDVNCDNISASYHNGVLHIQVQRQGKNNPTPIKIN